MFILVSPPPSPISKTLSLPLHSNVAFMPWRCGNEQYDGWMQLAWILYHHFPWGFPAAGREHHPRRWYLLQTRQLADNRSLSLCISQQSKLNLFFPLPLAYLMIVFLTLVVLNKCHKYFPQNKNGKNGKQKWSWYFILL